MYVCLSYANDRKCTQKNCYKLHVNSEKLYRNYGISPQKILTLAIASEFKYMRRCKFDILNGCYDGKCRYLHLTDDDRYRHSDNYKHELRSKIRDMKNKDDINKKQIRDLLQTIGDLKKDLKIKQSKIEKLNTGELVNMIYELKKQNASCVQQLQEADLETSAITADRDNLLHKLTKTTKRPRFGYHTDPWDQYPTQHPLYKKFRNR